MKDAKNPYCFYWFLAGHYTIICDPTSDQIIAGQYMQCAHLHFQNHTYHIDYYGIYESLLYICALLDEIYFSHIVFAEYSPPIHVSMIRAHSSSKYFAPFSSLPFVVVGIVDHHDSGIRQ